MLKDLIALAPESRVWIYPASREITYDELDAIRPGLFLFLERWTAHNKSLNTYGNVFHRRFLGLFVDESLTGASGCSIDSSVHFVQNLGQQLDIDFFNRQDIHLLIEEEVVTYKLNDLKSLFSNGIIDENTLFFNNLVKTKEQFLNSWVIPIKDGWAKRFI